MLVRLRLSCHAQSWHRHVYLALIQALLAAASQNCHIITVSVCVCSTLDKIKCNLRKEQRTVMELNFVTMHRILSPLQVTIIYLQQTKSNKDMPWQLWTKPEQFLLSCHSLSACAYN